ncbi:UPF0462 protein C4orf33 [Portunus trituberculatus]|uniref:UPF0462 protein C4orf33 n=1 Tax=Portunus trituberculatus TaxID=210409 RepID=A0A5B7CHC8_PORTR|nr:UPF0462 protein C4orf33 [Portunus trituberculatus]
MPISISRLRWGQHIVLLLSGQRITVRHSLQMKVETDIGVNTWTGSAAIPVTYLPERVTLFNAYAIHGSGADRVYESLYPAPSTAPNPDFEKRKGRVADAACEAHWLGCARASQPLLVGSITCAHDPAVPAGALGKTSHEADKRCCLRLSPLRVARVSVGRRAVVVVLPLGRAWGQSGVKCQKASSKRFGQVCLDRCTDTGELQTLSQPPTARQQ